MDWYLGGVSIALLIIGLVGQGFEMRKIKKSIYTDEDIGSANIFMDRRNFKWYGAIAIGIILWYIAERGLY